MVTVKEAYIKAKELTTSQYLQRILSFEKAFGFIFSTHRDGNDVGNLCIMISKDNPEESALIPIIPYRHIIISTLRFQNIIGITHLPLE